jgi:hypothetical protein
MLYLRINNHAQKSFLEQEEQMSFGMESKKKSKTFQDMEMVCLKQFSSILRMSKTSVTEQ